MTIYTNPVPSSFGTTQDFGANPNNGFNPAGGHTGRDTGTPVGIEVRAPADGVITVAGTPGTWDTNQYWLNGPWSGNVISLDAGPVVFHHAHLSEIYVSVNQQVRRGDLIGRTGATGGASTGPHIHFEAMPDGWNFQNGCYGRVDPAIYVKQDWEGNAATPTQPNHRAAGGSVVNQRDQPSTSGAVVRQIPANTLEVFSGFVHGELVTVGTFSSDVWFKDNIGYAWAGGFENSGTDGLPDLTPAAPVAANQRLVGAFNVNQRKQPTVAAEVVRTIEAGTKEVFDGFVHGESVTVNGFASDVWYVDHWGYAWCGGFEDSSTTGYQDFTTPTPPPPAPPATAPAPAPVPAVPHMNGIDVAKYQESAALQNLASDFYIIKATEGGSDYTDPALASNVAEARLSGRPVAFYHYARPLVTPENTAAEELRSFIKAILPYVRIGDRLALDWEAENKDRKDWAAEWLNGAAAAFGTKPWMYGYKDSLTAGDESLVAGFPAWFAGYGANPVTNGFAPPADVVPFSWAGGVEMWQYGSKGRLPGYSGDLDFNVFYGTAETWRAGGVTKIPGTDPGALPGDVKDFAAWIAGEGLATYLGRTK